MPDELVLTCKWGKLAINLTDGQHVHLTTDYGPYNRTNRLVYKGVEYAGSCHLYLHSSGSWNLGTEFIEDDRAPGGKRAPYPYELRRVQSFRRILGHERADNGVLSDAAFPHFMVEIIRAFNAWAKDNGAAITYAEYEAQEREHKNTLTEIDKLFLQLQTLNRIARQQEEAINALRTAHPSLPRASEHNR